MVFERAKRIRFSHCDPAGIIFYPRYAELLNEVVEDWFLECDFLAPARFGDTLTFRLAVSAIGGSSVQLAIEALRGETPCLRAALKIVLTSLDSFRAVPIDELWRGRFAAFQVET